MTKAINVPFLNTLYACEPGHFSTNVVWLSKLINLEKDFNEFSSRWLLFNQISDKSIFKGIHRIVAGKKVIINLSNNLKSYIKS